jgi:phosphatidate cytidylyltransferase
LVTAALGIPLLLLVVYLGGAPYLLLLAVTAGYGAFELLRMVRQAGLAAEPWLPIILSVALPLLAASDRPELPLLAVAWAVLVGLSLAMLRGDPDAPVGWAVGLGAALACGGLLACLAALRLGPDGLWWVLAVLVGTWTSDTAAYAAGRLLGRRPLAPRISPKKTVEGTIGALILTPLALLAFALLSPRPGLPAPIAPAATLPLGALLAVAATLGDLAESFVKRRCGVKDSGALLPGHGGLLDRIDGLLFAGVAGYSVALLVRA